jgi:hypothetical protein
MIMSPGRAEAMTCADLLVVTSCATLPSSVYEGGAFSKPRNQTPCTLRAASMLATLQPLAPHQCRLVTFIRSPRPPWPLFAAKGFDDAEHWQRLLFEHACKLRCEGSVAKRKDGP